DGKLVAFSANRGNVADQIWVANRDGTNIRQLTTFASGTAFYPKLDYFGKICTFESNQSGQYEVYTVYTDGTGLTDVSQNPGGADRVPWISADGDRVAWKSTRGGTNDVYMAYPDGTGLRKVSPFGNMSPSLTNDSHCINGDGTVLALASKYDYKGGNPEGDYEIYVWKDAFTAAGVARPGATITLTMEDATRPGAVYAVRCAFSRSPGIPIGGKIVPITPDVLFWLSGALPAVFQKFEGTLNAQGLGVAAVAIPNIPALTGIAFYSTFVSADPALEVYNPLKVLIW
ncbi:MAG: PD40 domain-containing protein, partial [Planctomycetes bacterium]|nr:PD40 domain-containing protein [Planctomycetota bacterium]